MTTGIHADAVLMEGAYVGPGARIDAGAVIGPNACVLGAEDAEGQPACVDAGARVGANATVLAGVRVGTHAVVEPGAVVARSVPPYAIVQGNPAVITGYVDAGTAIPDEREQVAATSRVLNGRVRGVAVHEFRRVSDLRGSLSVGEFERGIPFVPKRYFLVFDVPTIETRGEHAHVTCHQFLIAVAGSVSVVADDGDHREEFLLDRPNKGLFLPAMTWGIQYKYSADAVLLVFASEYYDAGDYIRDYDRFLEMVKARASAS